MVNTQGSLCLFVFKIVYTHFENVRFLGKLYDFWVKKYVKYLVYFYGNSYVLLVMLH